MCVSCNLEASFSKIVSSQGYMNDVQNSISVSGSYSAASFTASTTWRDIHQYTQTDAYVVASTTAVCSMYCATLNLNPVGTSPILTADFIDWINYLPSTYDATEYSQFVKTYGTHVPTSEKFGAMYGMYYVLTTSDYTSMEQQGIKIDAAASASAFGASVSAAWGNQQTTTTTATFSSKVYTSFSYSVGAPFPINGGTDFANSWMASTKSSPAPLYIQVVPIDSLINAKLFPSLSATRLSQVQSNIQQYLRGYCQELFSENVLVGVKSDCTLIPTTVTPPPPPPATCRLCTSCGGAYPSDQGSSVHNGDWGPYMMYGSSCGGSYQSSWAEAHLCCNGDSTTPAQGCTFCATACGGTYPYEAGRRLNQGDYGHWRTRNTGCNGSPSSLNDNRETVLCCKTNTNNCKWCDNSCGTMVEAGRRINTGDYGPYDAFPASSCSTSQMSTIDNNLTWDEVVLCCPI